MQLHAAAKAASCRQTDRRLLKEQSPRMSRLLPGDLLPCRSSPLACAAWYGGPCSAAAHLPAQLAPGESLSLLLPPLLPTRLR